MKKLMNGKYTWDIDTEWTVNAPAIDPRGNKVMITMTQAEFTEFTDKRGLEIKPPCTPSKLELVN